MGLTFTRHFTKDSDVYSEVNWKKYNAEIPDKNSSTGFVFKQDNVEFPDYFSQTAVNIIASKFFCGPLGTPERETSLKQVINRIVGTILEWGDSQDYFESSNSMVTFGDELKYMLLHQMVAFNSPVWFNVGNPYSKPQVSACYIVGVEDNMESILDNLKTEGMIFKYGSGAGSNRSNLRSSREFLSGGGKASGPNSYAKAYDALAGVIKSGGKTRRAAKMEILNADHGDIFEFINQKSGEEEVVKALIKEGYSSDFNDPNGAYSHAMFQNSNRTVRLSDSFMTAVENDEEWALIGRKEFREKIPIHPLMNCKTTKQGTSYLINNKWLIKLSNGKWHEVIEFVKARNLMREIAIRAWESGDPGMQFHDTINEWNTCKTSGEIVASNPCSEYMFLDDTSCNLASWRLTKFLNKDGKFNIGDFVCGINIMVTAMDIFINKAHYPTDKIAIETRKFRTLGLGYTDLGAFLMKLGIAYDSDDGRNYAATITSLMQAAAIHQSAKLAKAIGTFSQYNFNKVSVRDVIQKHYDATLNIAKTSNGKLYDIISQAIRLYSCFNSKDDKFIETPVRNAQFTVLAPTGTIGFIMDCDTTGCEPVLGLIQYKKLVGGGTIKIVPECLEKGLDKLNYPDNYIGEIIEYIHKNNTVVDAPHLWKDHYPVFATAFGDEKNIIPYSAHLKMMAAIQPFLSGAISKTVNLPNSATVEDVEKIYIEAWNLKLKAVALYRDGCKQSQPVTVNVKNGEKSGSVELKFDYEKSTIKVNEKLLDTLKVQRRRLPDTRPGITHKFSIGGHKGYLRTGEYEDGRLGEIFVDISKSGSTLSGITDSWATTFSIALQYGAKIEDLIAKFKGTQFEPAGITPNPEIRFASSIPDYIVKFLEIHYINNSVEKSSHVENAEELIKETTKVKISTYTGNFCPTCGGETIKAGTCDTCSVCGDTTGCG